MENKEVNQNLEDDTPVKYTESIDHESIKEGIVKCNLLNLREKPNKDSDIICILPKNSKLFIVSDRNKLFYKIKFKGITGYCMKNFIEEV